MLVLVLASSPGNRNRSLSSLIGLPSLSLSWFATLLLLFFPLLESLQAG